MIDNALDGMTVLELSQGIAGPYCASLLGEMGARVIKVEPPGGDWLRRAGGRVGASTAMFETFNRGKQSVVVDLKSKSGAAAVRQLAARCDVVIENSRAGSLQRLGLGFDELSAVKPQLVYTSITGFDPSGPYARRPATDTVIQAYTGLARHGTSHPDAPRLRIALADLVSGLYASQATLGAVVKRWRGGQGQWVQVNLTHAMAALQGYKIADTLLNGPSGELEAFAIVGNYATRGGPVSISSASDEQVVAGLRALGLDSLVEEPAFATAAQRQANQIALRGRVAAVLENMELADALERLQQAQVPCQRVLDYAAFVEDAQVAAPGLVQWLATAEGLRMPAVRAPGVTGGADLPRAPLLDEHAGRLKAEYQLEIE